MAQDVVLELLGEPTRRTHREWRWVTHGSARLLLKTGWWQDFGAGQNGGVLGLVHRLQGLDHYAALPATPRADNGVFTPVHNRRIVLVVNIPKLHADPKVASFHALL